MARWMAAAGGALLMAGAAAASSPPATPERGPDPHIWLEDIEGSKAIAWVRERNAATLPLLESMPGFEAHRARALAIFEDPRRIAYPSGAGPSGVTRTQVFNFWRDEAHIRGLWRVSPRAAYDAGRPEWRTLIDMDQLEAAEGRNWQFQSATCLAPDHGRCLVRLSVGGRDAVEVREFDTEAGRFVDGGFRTPEAKQTLAWADADRLLVASDFGPGTMTASGYPRQVRLWGRGTQLARAPRLIEASADDMGVWPQAFGEGRNRRLVIDQRHTFWTGTVHHVDTRGRLTRSPLPQDADFRFIANVANAGPRAFALLRTAWRGMPEGSLVSYPVPATGAASAGDVALVLAPSDTQAISGVEATGEAVYVALLDNVAARLVRLVPEDRRWALSEVELPPNSSVRLIAGDTQDTLYAAIEDFLEPARLVRVEGGAPPATLASAPAMFDGSRFETAQQFAVSADGTRVPYFVVRPRGARGPLPTMLFAYGGFEIPLTPSYVPPEVILWLEQGRQYVVANIRGGGEFGPRWHQSALLERRQNSYDDLHAVGEALKAGGAASWLAVHGRSNGGLMASVAFTQRPDLWDASMVGVPLADMARYHRLLAGASWMAEYGDPDRDDHWAFIGRYSPYHNLSADRRYPAPFFYTSTKDDRVHPAHARKMAARMSEYGQPYYYYENVDGGHAGVANLREAAYLRALMLAYLERQLAGTAATGP